MATKTNKTNTKTNEPVYWLNNDELENLAREAQRANLDLDGAIKHIEDNQYIVGDKQVNIKKFVAIWHGLDTNKAIKSFFK